MVDHYVPEYDKDSGSLRTYEYIQVLVQLGHKVVFWPDNRFRSLPYTEDLQQLGVEVNYGEFDFEDYIKMYGRFFHIAFLSRPYVAIKYLNIIKRNTNIYVIYDTVDLGFIRDKRLAELQGNSCSLENANSLKKTELYLASESDMVIVVSNLEKEILLNENKKLNVHVIPHVHRISSSIPGYEERDNIIFIGGFMHPPNEDGILWFDHKIFPKIKQELSGIKLYIIGSNPTIEILRINSEQIVVKGYVKDINPLFKTSRVFIAPLRYGGGINGKVLHSMSYGVPIVTTTIGAEGLDLIDGNNSMIANDETEFAEKVIRLYTDQELWNKLSRNSIEHLKRTHTSGACKDKFKQILKQIA